MPQHMIFPQLPQIIPLILHLPDKKLCDCDSRLEQQFIFFPKTIQIVQLRLCAIP